MADKMSFKISVGTLRVAVVGAELEVGGEERAGVVASASEKQEGFSFLPKYYLSHISYHLNNCQGIIS